MDASVSFLYEKVLSELQCCGVPCFHILGQSNNLWSTDLESRDVSVVGILVNVIEGAFHDMKVQTRTPE